MRYTIKDIPADMRPREKLLRYGPGVLTDQELLAIIIRTGSREANAIQLAESVLYQFKDLRGINNAGIEEICAAAPGIGNAKAAQIKAALELGRRLSQQGAEVVKIKSPKDVAAWVMEDLRYLRHEQFRILLLNTKNVIISCEEVSRGSLNASIVHPREVCQGHQTQCRCDYSCAQPSQRGPDSQPGGHQYHPAPGGSGEAGGIDVLDHLIIGDGIYCSLREKGYV